MSILVPLTQVLLFLGFLSLEVAVAALVRKEIVEYEEVSIIVEVNKETKQEGRLIESKDGTKIFLGSKLLRDTYLHMLQHVVIGDY